MRLAHSLARKPVPAARDEPARVSGVLVRGKLWSHINLDDEDEARRAIRRLQDDGDELQTEPRTMRRPAKSRRVAARSGVPVPEEATEVRALVAASLASSGRF